VPKIRNRSQQSNRKDWVVGGLLGLALLWAASGSAASGDESSPWKDNEWQGYCEMCDSGDVVHLIHDCPEWIDRSTAPSWVKFDSGWGYDNRRCESCGHEWKAY
jgi:hypothetical protein